MQHVPSLCKNKTTFLHLPKLSASFRRNKKHKNMKSTKLHERGLLSLVNGSVIAVVISAHLCEGICRRTAQPEFCGRFASATKHCFSWPSCLNYPAVCGGAFSGM